MSGFFFDTILFGLANILAIFIQIKLENAGILSRGKDSGGKLIYLMLLTTTTLGLYAVVYGVKATFGIK
jgi:hypothetical protein